MAKHKRERALFELLSQEKGRQKARPDTRPREGAAESPAAPTRIEQPGREQHAAREQPAAEPRRPARTIVTRKAVIAIGGVRLQTYHLLIVAVGIACLCYVFYLLGARFGGPGDGLPDVPAHPTMEAIQGRQPARDLVGPGPEEPALGRRVAPSPGGPRPGQQGPEERRPRRTPEPEPKPTGPQYRVRIARLDVSQPDAIDDLRAYLARSGIETDLVTRSGYHVLYSRRRFDEKTESDRLADQVNKSLAAFETETGRPTSKDAYTVQVERE